MLQALVSGKAGRIPGFDNSISWREAFRMSEDLLTASVFGRLCYLDGVSVWRILRRTFGHALPEYRIAELVKIEFWPQWNDSGARKWVEPDLFLEFKLGDPQVTVRMIVEAKLGQSPAQSADQWLRQWASYRDANDNDDTEVFLAAIGGMGRNVDTTVAKLVNAVNANGHEIKAVAAGWDRMLTALHEERMRCPSVPAARVIDDMVAALAMAGYQHLSLLSDFDLEPRNWDRNAFVTLGTLE